MPGNFAIGFQLVFVLGSGMSLLIYRISQGGLVGPFWAGLAANKWMLYSSACRELDLCLYVCIFVQIRGEDILMGIKKQTMPDTYNTVDICIMCACISDFFFVYEVINVRYG